MVKETPNEITVYEVFGADGGKPVMVFRPDELNEYVGRVVETFAKHSSVGDSYTVTVKIARRKIQEIPLLHERRIE